jgi:hypothetical protein
MSSATAKAPRKEEKGNIALNLLTGVSTLSLNDHFC